MDLPNTSKGAFKQIKETLQERIAGLDAISATAKSYTRFRYADNLNQWLEIAAVVINDKSTLRVIFIYLSNFQTAKKEARYNSVTATYSLEVIYQFIEGTDEDNSTQAFEDMLGDLNDLFLSEEAIGAIDASGNPVLNTPLSGLQDEGGARPQIVDGVLAHRKITTLDITFRLCKGG